MTNTFNRQPNSKQLKHPSKRSISQPQIYYKTYPQLREKTVTINLQASKPQLVQTRKTQQQAINQSNPNTSKLKTTEQSKQTQNQSKNPNTSKPTKSKCKVTSMPKPKQTNNTSNHPNQNLSK